MLIPFPRPPSPPALLRSRPSLAPPPPAACSTSAFRHNSNNDGSISSNRLAPPFPFLEVVGGPQSLLSEFNSLRKPYKPFPILGWNRHLETIFAALFRSVPDVTLRRECIRARDDGAVSLDWVSGDDEKLPFDAPLLILLPGLTGGSHDSYVRHMLVRARRKGWRVVVFNSRGCGNGPVTTPQFYSASFTGDLCEVVTHVGTRYAKSRIYAMGWSLGANILVRYLGQESQSCPLSGAVSLCNPFNLVTADENFHKGFNNVYNRSLAGSLSRIFKRHALLFEGIGGEYNIELVAKAKIVREFDEGLTRVSFGFKSVDEYYANSSSSLSVVHVRTPLLCIQAANDPIAPSRGIPRQDIKENPYCILIVTPQGGHLGWVAGDEAPFGAPWTDSVALEYLELLDKEKFQITCPNLLDLGQLQQSVSAHVPECHP